MLFVPTTRVVQGSSQFHNETGMQTSIRQDKEGLSVKLIAHIQVVGKLRVHKALHPHLYTYSWCSGWV